VSAAEKLDRARCVSCGGAPAREILSRRDRELKNDVTLLECGACGLVYLEQWTEGFDAELYEYYAERKGRPLEERFDRLNQKRQGELLEEIAQRVNGRRLLDVGCGEGQFVYTASQNGWDARGIDLAEPAIDLCRAHGLPCTRTDFFDASLDRERFDLIIMSELIEHVPSPARFLSRAQELLAPRGVLYMTTPNFASLTRRIVGPEWVCIHREHVAYFSPATLRAVLDASLGECDVELRSRNTSPAAIVRKLRRPRGAAPVKARATAVRTSDQRLRKLVLGSTVLRRAQGALNAGLDRLGLGDTLVVTAQRR
jgi:2-polyprenyl-3-methyl-5-hydroxy-6-metoxy-1,4-benzoquinol methylase